MILASADLYAETSGNEMVCLNDNGITVGGPIFISNCYFRSQEPRSTLNDAVNTLNTNKYAKDNDRFGII